MARSALAVAERVLGGKVTDHLRDWRAEGLSFNAISLELRDLGITVTGETVRNWCRDLGIETAA